MNSPRYYSTFFRPGMIQVKSRLIDLVHGFCLVIGTVSPGLKRAFQIPPFEKGLGARGYSCTHGEEEDIAICF